MRKLFFIILTTTALSLAAAKPPTLKQVEAATLDIEYTDGELTLVGQAGKNPHKLAEALATIYENRMKHFHRIVWKYGNRRVYGEERDERLMASDQEGIYADALERMLNLANPGKKISVPMHGYPSGD